MTGKTGLVLLGLLSTHMVQSPTYRIDFKVPYRAPIVLAHKEVKPIKTELVKALILVESSGNDSAYNAIEDAVGCLQIRPIMVREVNRILKMEGKDKRYKLKDRWDRNLSIEMFNIWKSYHHDDSSEEKVARNWNGGPKGYAITATEPYWEKVIKAKKRCK